MVKVENFFEEELQDKKYFEISLNLAEDIFSGLEIKASKIGLPAVSVKKGDQHILTFSSSSKTISLYSKEHYDSAMKFATEYENLIGEELTLSLHYKE